MVFRNIRWLNFLHPAGVADDRNGPVATPLSSQIETNDGGAVAFDTTRWDMDTRHFPLLTLHMASRRKIGLYSPFSSSIFYSRNVHSGDQNGKQNEKELMHISLWNISQDGNYCSYCIELDQRTHLGETHRDKTQILGVLKWIGNLNDDDEEEEGLLLEPEYNNQFLLAWWQAL